MFTKKVVIVVNVPFYFNNKVFYNNIHKFGNVIVIIRRVNKERTKGEIVGISDKNKSSIVKTILIITSQLLFAIFQIVMACVKF